MLVSFQSYGLCKLDLFPSSELGTTAASENFRHMSRSTFPTQPTQLFSIVLALINFRHRPEGPGLESILSTSVIRIAHLNYKVLLCNVCAVYCFYVSANQLDCVSQIFRPTSKQRKTTAMISQVIYSLCSGLNRNTPSVSGRDDVGCLVPASKHEAHVALHRAGVQILEQRGLPDPEDNHI